MELVFIFCFGVGTGVLVNRPFTVLGHKPTVYQVQEIWKFENPSLPIAELTSEMQSGTVCQRCKIGIKLCKLHFLFLLFKMSQTRKLSPPLPHGSFYFLKSKHCSVFILWKLMSHSFFWECPFFLLLFFCCSLTVGSIFLSVFFLPLITVAVGSPGYG